MLGKRKAQWSESHYMIVFESVGITKGTHPYQDPATGGVKTTVCLFGIAPRDEE
jgi:hypothetical protein